MQHLKKSHIIVTIIIIAGIFSLGLFLTKKNPRIPDWQITKQTNESFDVAVNVTKKSENTGAYSIDAEIPRVVIKNHAGLSATINAQLEDYVRDAVASFKEETFDNDALPSGANAGTNPESESGVQNPSMEKSTFTIQYSSFENVHNRFLTIEFGASSYVSGAAHPLSFTHVINFNLADGKPVGLHDLFSVEETQYLDKISIYSKKEIRKKLIEALSLNSDGSATESSTRGTDSNASGNLQDNVEKGDVLEGVFFEEGANPLSQNYSEFKIKPEGLEFIFGQYQVAPYVVGEIRVLVPYSELQGMLKV